ncbi:hypothetical protein TNIN_434491 [Trichonephila inaurata madagascariensis]|uniref:Uncharacterized protein n=1 Tax=Trichonephila inaurata madagascariensis TaxID=2747483 RepID=A0A8X6MBK9_9ARAC|nr:hypothetical protein TNIN_434491 [Trichonephila inaurata madagascariensis]
MARVHLAPTYLSSFTFWRSNRNQSAGGRHLIAVLFMGFKRRCPPTSDERNYTCLPPLGSTVLRNFSRKMNMSLKVDQIINAYVDVVVLRLFSVNVKE